MVYCNTSKKWFCNGRGNTSGRWGHRNTGVCGSQGGPGGTSAGGAFQTPLTIPPVCPPHPPLTQTRWDQARAACVYPIHSVVLSMGGTGGSLGGFIDVFLRVLALPFALMTGAAWGSTVLAAAWSGPLPVPWLLAQSGPLLICLHLRVGAELGGCVCGLGPSWGSQGRG